MSVKEEILKIMKENKEVYLSGEEMAGKLGVSRAAVCKAVKALKQEGYEIEGLNRRGYRMAIGDDILSVEGIRQYVSKEVNDRLQIEVYPKLTSTNTVLKEKAAGGAEEWLVVLAVEQTAGKGRMNRTFYSPSDTGLYMSILLKPAMEATQALFLTTMTAVAVAEAIDEMFQIETKIKWVNDLYYQEKKICGILTEAAINVENASLDYAVVGIGVNIAQPKGAFPEELRNKAGAILAQQPKGVGRDNLKNRLAAKIIEHMSQEYAKLHTHAFMERYREKSMLIGKEVYRISDVQKEKLRVLEIDENAALVVEYMDGHVEALRSGEVSVSMIDNESLAAD